VSADGAPRLQAKDIHKSFAAVVALSEANLELQPREVHALLGANGAGKSTLVKVLTGVHRPDRGEVLIDGEPVELSSPGDATDAGVAVVFQDPPLFPHLDVAENIFAGAYPRAALGLIDDDSYHRRAGEVLDSLHIELDPHRLVQELSVAEREFVAIARALQRESRVLILDEPTASLTPEETRRLFDVVRKYRDGGGAVLFISHRLEEVQELADRVTVFRDGRDVFTARMTGVSQARIVAEMLGRELEEVTAAGGAHAAAEGREAVLAVRGLSLRRQYDDVSFDVGAGEIVALAGLVGSGRTEVVETLIGLRHEDAGEVLVGGKRVRRRTPRAMAELGVVLVPEDRDAEGLVYGFSLAENIALPNQRKVSRRGLLRRRAESRVATEQVRALSIRTEGVTADVASLSGGNRQKVVLGKWLASNPRVLLLDEPTKGVDVGAKAEIHAIIRDLARRENLAVLVVTSDFEEVGGLADRVLVMQKGRLVAEISGERADAAVILEAASTSAA
jgi:rhamnose transport system ATP-binding protein